MDVLGLLDGLAGVRAGTLKGKDDAAAGSGSNVPGKRREHLGKEGSGHSGRQPPLGLAGTWSDEAARDFAT